MEELRVFPAPVTTAAMLLGSGAYVFLVALYEWLRRLPPAELRKHGFEFRLVSVRTGRGQAVMNAAVGGAGPLAMGAVIEGGILALFHMFFFVHLFIASHSVAYVAAAMMAVNVAVSFELMFRLKEQQSGSSNVANVIGVVREPAA